MLRALAIAALLLRIAAAHADAVPLPGAADGIPVGRYAEVLEDPGGALRLADVAGPGHEGRFARAAADTPNFGYTYSAFWLRFALPQDTVARYGGDEFVVLAGELDRAEDVANIAKKIADMVSLPVSIDGATEKVGCSIGISIYPDHAEDAEGLIERADRAMYAAKSAKDPRYVFFSPA